MNSQIVILDKEAVRKEEPTSELSIYYSKDEMLPSLCIRCV